MSCEYAETLCLIWNLIKHLMSARDSLLKGLWYMHCILFRRRFPGVDKLLCLRGQWLM
jgi:hypothetical protein